jgi:hypothetical protein
MLGLTLASLREFGWVGVADSRLLSWGSETGSLVPAAARTVVNRGGLLLQVWV